MSGKVCVFYYWSTAAINPFHVLLLRNDQQLHYWNKGFNNLMIKARRVRVVGSSHCY